MDIRMFFNWPLNEDLAICSVGLYSVEDPLYLFNIGVIKKEDSSLVFWHSDIWMEAGAFAEIKNFRVHRTDVVRVERKEKNTGEVLAYEWKIFEEWPPEASGNSSTEISWTL